MLVLCIRALFFFVAFEKANPMRGHNFFLFFWGCQKSKSNRRAQGLCFCFFGADFIFQKCSAHLGFLHFDVQIKLSLASCALFVDNFPRSSPEPEETETLLRRPQEPHYPTKKSCPRMFSPVISRAPERLLVSISHTREVLLLTALFKW